MPTADNTLWAYWTGGQEYTVPLVAPEGDATVNGVNLDAYHPVMPGRLAG